MSQSKARKKRMHIKRTIGKDLEQKRQSSPFSTHERVTKTKKEAIEQRFTKYKKHIHIDI